VTADSGKRSEGATAFERFRDLARKLVQVPKREADAEQAKESESREQEPERRD
jgi:hypothetical protein